MNDPANHVHLFSALPGHPQVLFLGLHSGTYRTSDAGIHWQLVEPSQDQLIITALSASRFQPERLYALGFTANSVSGALNGVLSSTDEGQSWQAINGDLPNQATALLVRAGSTPGEVFAFLPQAGLFRTTYSHGSNPHWQQISTTLPRTTHSLLDDPIIPGEMLAVTDEGFYHSDKDGTIWQLLPGTPPAIALTLTNSRQPRLVYSTGIEGFYRSTDGGRHFLIVNNTQLFQALAVTATTPPILYGSDGKNISSSTDEGRTWQQLAPLLQTAASIAGVQVESTNPHLIYAVTSLPVRFFRSTDGGKSWLEKAIG